MQRIPEELEFEPGLLDYLEEAGVLPGREGEVTAISTDGATTVELAGGSSFGIDEFAGKRIVVTPT